MRCCAFAVAVLFAIVVAAFVAVAAAVAVAVAAAVVSGVLLRWVRGNDGMQSPQGTTIPADWPDRFLIAVPRTLPCNNICWCQEQHKESSTN